MVNHCRDMWACRSHVLALLAALMSKTAKWVWTDEHAKAFDKTKKILSGETSSAHLDFNETFDAHADASD